MEQRGHHFIPISVKRNKDWDRIEIAVSFSPAKKLVQEDTGHGSLTFAFSVLAPSGLFKYLLRWMKTKWLISLSPDFPIFGRGTFIKQRSDPSAGPDSGNPLGSGIVCCSIFIFSCSLLGIWTLWSPYGTAWARSPSPSYPPSDSALCSEHDLCLLYPKTSKILLPSGQVLGPLWRVGRT